MKAQVAVIGILRFPPENIQSVMPYLEELVQATKQNDGCILYEVAEDLFDKGLVRFSELWPSRESMEKHLLAPHIEPWRAKAKAFGLMEREFHSYDLIGDSVPI